MHRETRPPLILLDPGNFTPQYDMNLGSSLMEQGWDVEWVTSRHPFEHIAPPGGLRIQESFFRRFPCGTRNGAVGRRLRRAAKATLYPIDLLRFHAQIKSRVPGVIHVQWSHLPWLDAALWGTWKQRGWKVVFTAHDVRPLDGTTPKWFDHGFRAAFQKADAVVVHSTEGSDTLREMGIGTTKVELLPPAPSLHANGAFDRVEAKKKLQLPVDRPVVLFFGFIKPYKGLNVLLRSFPQVRNALDAHLIIAGEALESRRKYKKQISLLGLSDCVHWIGNYIPSSSVATYFSAADVVVLPYLDASSSAVLLGAYSFERPVVATSVGGLPELVEEGKTGMLVPPHNPEALTAAILEMLRNPKMAGEMGLRARDRLEQNYTWPLLARRLSNLYQRLWNQNNA